MQVMQGSVGLALFCYTQKSWVGSKAKGWKHLRSCSLLSLGKKCELLCPEDRGTLYFAKMAIAIFLVLYSLLEISHSFINKWESEFFFPLILWKMVSALTNKSVADILSALTVEAGL